MSKLNSSDGVIFLCSLVRERANGYISMALAERGIDDLLPAHGAVLQVLFENHGMTMGDLAKAARRKKNTLTTLVRSLEKNGYLSKMTDPDDSRVQNVFLTDKGRETCRIQHEISLELLGKVWSGVAFEQRKLCADILLRIAANFE